MASIPPIRLRQLCWAHLRRDFQKWVDRGGAAKPLGQALLRQTKKLFVLAGVSSRRRRLMD